MTPGKQTKDRYRELATEQTKTEILKWMLENGLIRPEMFGDAYVFIDVDQNVKTFTELGGPVNG